MSEPAEFVTTFSHTPVGAGDVVFWDKRCRTVGVWGYRWWHELPLAARFFRGMLAGVVYEDVQCDGCATVQVYGYCEVDVVDISELQFEPQKDRVYYLGGIDE